MLTKHLLAIRFALPIFANVGVGYAGANNFRQAVLPRRPDRAPRPVAPRVQYSPGAAHDNASADPEESAAPPACCDASIDGQLGAMMRTARPAQAGVGWHSLI